MNRIRRLFTPQDLAVLLLGFVILLSTTLTGVLWKPPAGTDASALRDTLVVLMSSIGGVVFTVGFSGFLSTQAVVNAVSAAVGQNPEFVADYFKPEKVQQFLENNLEVRLGDKQLSRAVAHDLLGPYLGRTLGRVRPDEKYSVELALVGSGDPSDGTLWQVREDLRFMERLPLDVRTGQTVAALVFCESALAPWFARGECMYRSVVFMPRAASGTRDERERWVAAHLGCELWLGGVKLDLEARADVAGASMDDWVVEYVLATPQAAIDRALANARIDEASGHAHARIGIRSRLTLAPWRRYYTAYVAYPTFDPEIEFRLTGPVERLEVEEFYNAASNPDVIIERVQDEPGSRHVHVGLAEPRWVFTMSGVAFSWTLTSDAEPALPAVE